MQKLIVAFPLHRQVSVKFFTNYLKMDRTAVIDEIIVDGPPIVDAMNSIVELALRNLDWDRLVIFEHDMVPGRDALARIAHYPVTADIVGSMYFRHEPPHEAYVYVDGQSIDSEIVEQWCSTPALYPCDTVGLGFTSIARHVLEDWDPGHQMFFRTPGIWSHDFWFCSHARDQGYNVYADSAIICGHLTEVEIGRFHNESAHKAAKINPRLYRELNVGQLPLYQELR